MTTRPLSPLRTAWLRWKSLRSVPFRKRFLVGLDLQGNTYWEFQDKLAPGRMRRIVEYPSNTHYSEIKLKPQWHQWLRHTRKDAPSLQEQHSDEVRLQNLKLLAAEADRRWAAKESVLDAPVEEDTLPLSNNLGSDGAGRLNGEEDTWIPGTNAHKVEAAQDGADIPRRMQNPRPQDRVPRFSELPDERRKEYSSKPSEDPWKQERGGPSEQWQPEAAQLTPAKR